MLSPGRGFLRECPGETVTGESGAFSGRPEGWAWTAQVSPEPQELPGVRARHRAAPSSCWAPRTEERGQSPGLTRRGIGLLRLRPAGLRGDARGDLPQRPYRPGSEGDSELTVKVNVGPTMGGGDTGLCETGSPRAFHPAFPAAPPAAPWEPCGANYGPSGT